VESICTGKEAHWLSTKGKKQHSDAKFAILNLSVSESKVNKVIFL